MQCCGKGMWHRDWRSILIVSLLVSIGADCVFAAPAPPAELTSVSFGTTIADPINGTANPKAIPGATIVYTITTSNLTTGEVDRNTTLVVTSIPPGTSLFVNSFPGSTGGPVLFVEGSPASGLSLQQGRRGHGHGRSKILYSDNGGTSFRYKPVPDALGYDPAVTHIKVRLSGVFQGRDATGPSNFSLRFQLLLK